MVTVVKAVAVAPIHLAAGVATVLVITIGVLIVTAAEAPAALVQPYDDIERA